MDKCHLKNKVKNIHIILVLSVLTLVVACNKKAMPKPYGYFRIELPEAHYRTMDTLNYPYRFEISTLTKVEFRQAKKEKFWLDIQYPSLNATLYCSYKPIQGNLFELSEDSRKYVYKHSVKADGIAETAYSNADKRVYGIFYDILGNTASSMQFIVTDSTKNFFRGALYFENVPNKDSIAPMLQYIRKDMIRLMETFEWKNDL